MPVATGLGRSGRIVVFEAMTGLGRRTGAAVTLLIAIGLLSLGLAVSASADGGEAHCENESLRSVLGSHTLTECRAYEMVTPPYKEGYPVLAFPSSAYSTDGNKAMVFSLGALGGASGNGESATQADLYVEQRAPSGWQITPLNAPSSEFAGEIPVSVEADSGVSLWKQHTLGQSAFTIGLYRRSPGADGEFSFIGPLTLPPEGPEEPNNVTDLSRKRSDSPVAATSDYQHVLLAAVVPEDYWPFDPTIGSGGSLYEYAGTGNSEPTLVGVEGPKGSRNAVGVCGTELGGSGSAYNALSSDGEVVFFSVLPGCGTPAATEIYARLHGSLASPEAPATEHISARECSNACGAEESGKNFEGASEDGQRVFFTSTQKLTNDAVDGTAGGDSTKQGGCTEIEPGLGGCNLYEYDFADPKGARLKLIAGGEVLGVAGAAEDGSRIYFVSRSAIASAGVNQLGNPPENGLPNLYVYNTETGKMAFIGALVGSEDSNDWRKLFELRTSEVAGEGGRYLLFVSSAPDLTLDDRPTSESPPAQLFEYKAENNSEPAELVRITKGEDGYDENGNGVGVGVELSTIYSVNQSLGNGTDFKSSTNRSNISSDGRTVFFLARGELSPRATSAAPPLRCRSLYEFHTDGAFLDGSVHVISDGRDTQPYKGGFCGPQFEGMDATGANVLFTSDDPLVPADLDGAQRDIYDARVGGGFAPAPGGESGLCAACEGPSTGTLGFPALGSVGQPAEAPVPTTPVPRKKKAAAKKRSSGKLGRALRACRAKRRRVRAACERSAHRRYGSKASATKSSRRG
jgi:hypothetical protein